MLCELPLRFRFERSADFFCRPLAQLHPGALELDAEVDGLGPLTLDLSLELLDADPLDSKLGPIALVGLGEEPPSGIVLVLAVLSKLSDLLLECVDPVLCREELTLHPVLLALLCFLLCQVAVLGGLQSALEAFDLSLQLLNDLILRLYLCLGHLSHRFSRDFAEFFEIKRSCFQFRRIKVHRDQA